MVVGYLLLLPMLQSLAAQPVLPGNPAPAAKGQTVTVYVPAVASNPIKRKHATRHHIRHRAHAASTHATSAPSSASSSSAPAVTQSSSSGSSNRSGVQVLSSTQGALAGSGAPGLNGICQGAGCP
jgi:hypothetical protein